MLGVFRHICSDTQGQGKAALPEFETSRARGDGEVNDFKCVSIFCVQNWLTHKVTNSGILNDVIKLRKALEPKADVHRRRDLEELKAHVEQVQALVQRLPPGNPHDLRFDLNLGVKGIIQTSQPRKKSKPDLSVEDDL